MIRSMQERVNARTAMYRRGVRQRRSSCRRRRASRTPRSSEKFEAVRSARSSSWASQKKIFKVTDDIAKGKNKAN